MPACRSGSCSSAQMVLLSLWRAISSSTARLSAGRAGFTLCIGPMKGTLLLGSAITPVGKGLSARTILHFLHLRHHA